MSKRFEGLTRQTTPVNRKQKMKKSELIETISVECNVTKALAKRMLDTFEKKVIHTLKWGGKVELLNFFTLIPYKTKQRKIVNPRTREPLTIKARHRVQFRMGKGFKEALN